MSRRQFLKLTGKAAAAAASPQSALKGLAGSLVPSIPGAKVAIAVRPGDDLMDIGKALAGIQGAYNAAKKIGDGKVGGAAAGCGSEFEILTFGNMDTINQLVKSGKLKQVTYKGETTTLDKFSKPLSPEETSKITQEASQKILQHLSTDPYRDYPLKMRPVVDITDHAEVKKYVNHAVENALEDEVRQRSELRFHDNEGNNYWITADNEIMQDKTSWFKNVIEDQKATDPLLDWWEMYFGYSDFADIEFSKPVLELIKQKGLYRRVDDPFGMRKLMDAFEEFKVAPPSDIEQVLERFRKRPSYHDTSSKWHSQYDDIKPGEDYADWRYRKTQELNAATKQKEEQKKEFDEAPPPSDEPDSWRTQSVEFESRLRRLVR